MKSTSPKHKGFGLIEVIISMAVIAIISVGVYNSYLLLIRQTKEGQVKQTAALEGKQAIEEIKTAAFEKGGANYSLKLDGKTLVGTQNVDNNSIKFSTTDGDYTELITFKRTQTSSEEEVDSNDNQSSDLKSTNNYKIYIGKDNETSKDYITDNLEDDDYRIELAHKSSDSSSKELIISVYLDEKADDPSKENIKICDYKAQNFLEATENIDKDLVINFSKYKEADGSVPTDVEVKINIYNKTTTISNIYIQKPIALDAEVKARKGEINIYNNRAEDETDMGDLYDITVNVTHKGGDTIFTGYSKQNIVGWE